MNNTQLNKALESKNGFWIKLKDINDDNRIDTAKILINDEGLTLYTLLEEAPTINIYDASNFTFLSTDKDVLLIVNGNGYVYDWWDYDCSKTPMDYTESFLSTWNLNKDEFEKYSQEEESKKLLKLKISKVNQDGKPCEM